MLVRVVCAQDHVGNADDHEGSNGADMTILPMSSIVVTLPTMAARNPTRLCSCRSANFGDGAEEFFRQQTSLPGIKHAGLPE